jgi:serine/threonine-protein kinase
MAERFTLLSELGRGGMGVVWKARDTETGQIVALKLLRAAYSEDPDYVARFERELELAKRIHSQNVVQVLGYGVRDGTPYLSLEFVDGPSLREILKAHGPYSWPEARQVLTQLAEGLADAHATGVIHRDMKPSNVLVGPDGVAKIADFGIAKGLDLARVTGTSTLLGTPAYLPPEGPADQRSDLYSLGVIAYEIMTGVVPFEGRTYQDVILAHVRTPPDLNRLPPEARPIIGWLLAKDPNARPQTARQLIRALSGTERVPMAGPGAAAPYAPVPQVPPQWSGVGQPYPRAGGRGNGKMMPIVVGAVAVVAILGTLVAVSIGRNDSSGNTPTSAIEGTPTAGAVDAASPVATSGIDATPPAAPAVPTGQWLKYGLLPTYLWGSGIAQLADGRVAIFSACVDGNCKTAKQNTWVLDPKAMSVVAGDFMTAPQLNPAVAVFNDGRTVMIAGGRDASGTPIKSAEILDLATGAFQTVPSMSSPRDQATATDIGSGRVLITGGFVSKTSTTNTSTASAEVFDVKTMKWSPVNPMSVPRALAAATSLKDGRVLVAGGVQSWKGGQYAPNTQHVLSTAEIFDPATEGWTSAGSMSTARAANSAALLPNGDVLVAGGWSDGHERALSSTDEYTPGVGWRAGNTMPGPHSANRMVTLKDGRLLVIGGLDVKVNATAETDIFDPVSGSWKRTGNLTQPSRWPATVTLDDGRVLLVGGLPLNPDGTSTIEIYTP